VSGLLAVLAGVGAALRREGRDFALVGGLAVSARTDPRFTRDVDLAVAVRDDPDAEGLVRALSGGGYRVLALVEHEAAGRLATVRLLPPGGDEEGAVVDLLFASSGIEADLVARAEPLALAPGLSVKVARAEDLLALKLLARDDLRRPQDRSDSLALAGQLDDEGLGRVERALASIERAGFQRGRDLQAALRTLRAELGR
jgi:predicted nucleotidyltransferase